MRNYLFLFLLAPASVPAQTNRPAHDLPLASHLQDTDSFLTETGSVQSGFGTRRTPVTNAVAGTAYAIDREATNQVAAIALAAAQSVGAIPFGNGAANATVQTNIYGWDCTNLCTTHAPYTGIFAANELLSLLNTTDPATGALLPLVSAGNDFGPPNLDGTITAWGYDVTDPMMNCGRFFGNCWNWQLASPGSDTRALIIKGEAASTSDGGGCFVLETRACAGAPGNHGLFCNPMFVCTNGLICLGNLTDRIDYNQNLLKPQAWVTVYGDGAGWPGGSSTLPAFALAAKPLVPAPMADGQEYDGANWYFTDANATRWRMSQSDTNGVLLVPTNLPAGTPPAGYCGFWASNYDLYWVSALKTNLVVPGR